MDPTCCCLLRALYLLGHAYTQLIYSPRCALFRVCAGESKIKILCDLGGGEIAGKGWLAEHGKSRQVQTRDNIPYSCGQI